MKHIKTSSKNILFIGASVFALSACGHPNAMPSGYTHHHDAFNAERVENDFVLDKRTESPAASALSYENAGLSLGDLNNAVDDMLRKITARAGVSPKPVYVLKPSNPTRFYNAMDSALRTSMRDLGYAISDIEEGAYAFAYNARPIRKPRHAAHDGHPNVELMLQVYNQVGAGARLLTEQSGNYFIMGAQEENIPTLLHDFPKGNKISESKSMPVQKRMEPAFIKRSDIIIEEPEIPALIARPVIISPIERTKSAPITPDVNFKSLSAGRISSDYNSAPIARDVINKEPSMISGKVSKPVEY